LPEQSSIDNVQRTVVGIVEDLIQDWGLELQEPISERTRLSKELDFVSVDFIQLLEAIEQHYGRKFGFQDLVMKNGSYTSDLSIGQIAEFVGKALGSEE